MPSAPLPFDSAPANFRVNRAVAHTLRTDAVGSQGESSAAADDSGEQFCY